MDDPFWGRYAVPVGQSVVKTEGTYVVTPFPWQGDLDGLTQGVDYFLGGRTYPISDDTADALEADGFTTDRTSGYGEGEYSEGGYGQ